MILGIFLVNYVLLILFSKEYYIVYFLILFFTTYMMKSKPTLVIPIILMSPFIFEYFDDFIFSLYLYVDMNAFYTFIGGDIIYLLSILHSFVFFLGYNRKKYL